MRRALATTLVLLAGCGGSTPGGPPVPVEGAGHHRGILTGEWEGAFQDACGARHGTIAFVLPPGHDTARGRVVLEPVRSAGCTDPVSSATRGDSVPAGMVLRLGGVTVADRSVSGWIQEYRDPERDCPVDTWFEGGLEGGDTLRGMYFAHPEVGDTVRRGTWWAVRRR